MIPSSNMPIWAQCWKAIICGLKYPAKESTPACMSSREKLLGKLMLLPTHSSGGALSAHSHAWGVCQLQQDTDDWVHACVTAVLVSTSMNHLCNALAPS